MTDYARPYRGLKVLDMSQGVAGPHAGMLLALYGADVIKVEPEAGDWIRPIGVRYGQHSAHGVYYSRGKRSIALDMKSEAGLEIIYRLARDADVVIESFRPGVADRLKIGYEDIRRINRRALYLSVSGFGQEGPYRERPCTDTVAQAFSGLMSVNTGNDGAPVKVGAVLVDSITGLFAYQAVATALYARGQTGEGRHIDVSLMQGAAAILAPKILEAHLQGGTPQAFNPPAGNFETKDGWIAVTLVRDAEFVKTARLIGLPHLADDPRLQTFANRAEHLDELMDQLRTRYREKTTAEWMAILKPEGILCEPVNTFNDWLADEHVRAVQAAPAADQPGVGESPLARVPGAPQSPADIGDAPGIGQHGDAILAELGYAPDEIADMAAKRAVFLGEKTT
ncbi:CaiB/BaiF CoA transferase family protein [Minwuia thermotolerans]|uniref:CoA transferase n=1 Tax=Minwuia thermotolerans TaxID=2056226 RepID=A0A2M9G2T0_9PROT|nr:CoA transferase [Minwuia thermotolerans]PJK30029.1 CoA transferase [Minwuia thermotolerans]